MNNTDRFLDFASSLADFHPGPGMTVVNAFGREAGLNLPQEVLALLAECAQVSIDDWHLFDISRIGAEFEWWAKAAADNEDSDIEADDGVRPTYWNRRWVPLFGQEHSVICVDLDPSESGHVGQLIIVYDDSPERKVVSKSLDAFFGSVMSAVESGLLAIEDGLLRSSDLDFYLPEDLSAI